MGDYNAKFRTATLTGDKLTGAYDYPPDPQGEVTVTGSFELKSAMGTWSLARRVSRAASRSPARGKSSSSEGYRGKIKFG
jgi:hypothetical protein